MKKIFAVLLVATMIAASISVLASAAVKSDINGDGESDNKDVVVLFRYVSGVKKADDESVYDFNEDGSVDNKDVIALFRALSGGVEALVKDIYLYAAGEGGAGAGTAAQYEGRDFLTARRTTKSNMPEKTVQIFGESHTASYLESFSFDAYGEEYDMYMSDGALFTFGAESGRLVTYESLTGIRADGFEPPVNEQSGEDDIINYAKEVLLEYAKTSTDDCDVVVTTNKNKYSIVFRKKFNGIYLIDDISMTISKSGDVLKFAARTCGENVGQFEQTEIDATGLKKQVRSIFPNPGNGGYEIILRAIPYGDELWVLIEIEYEYVSGENTLKNSIRYITKVVESPAVS